MDFTLLLPEIILFLGILVVFFLDLFLERNAFKINVFLGGITPLASLISLLFVNYPATTLYDMIYVDKLNLFGKAIVYVISSLAVFSLHDYFEKKNSLYGELPYLILTSTLGLSLLLSSNNLAMIFMSLELSSIAIYIMVGMLRGDYLSKEGAFKYLVMGSLASASFGLGSAFYYASTGTLFIKEYLQENTLFMVGMFFLLSALALKISAVPFHMWTPDVYQSSPTPVTAYISTAPKLALYFLLAKFVLIFSYIKAWLILVSILALISMFYANLSAYAQTYLKRLLAYSTIAHSGYFLLALTSGNKTLLNALLFYVIVYSFATLGAFTVIASLEKREGFTDHLLDYRGLYKESPIMAILLALFLFAFIGIPPMALFVGKLGIFMGLVESKLLPLAIAFVIASIVSAGYYLKVIVYMFLQEGERKFLPSKVSTGESLALLFSTLAVILLGLFPNIVMSFLKW